MAYKDSIEVGAHAVDKEYSLRPGEEYTFLLNGDGTWQFWDGAAWKDYSNSTGSSQGFVGIAPPSGRVNLNVTSGTVNAGFERLYPRTYPGHK